MAIFKEIRRRVEDSWIEVKATVVAGAAVKMMAQTFQDIGLAESQRELSRLSTDEFVERVQNLGEQMADMRPNELQEFVNSKIEHIEDENRKKMARLLLQETVKDFVSDKEG